MGMNVKEKKKKKKKVCDAFVEANDRNFGI